MFYPLLPPKQFLSTIIVGTRILILLPIDRSEQLLKNGLAIVYRQGGNNSLFHELLPSSIPYYPLLSITLTNYYSSPIY
jgi:hypothetical protein